MPVPYETLIGSLIPGRLQMLAPAAPGSGRNGHTTNGIAGIQPKRKDTPEARASVERLRHVLQKIYDETGMTEDEFASYFDMTKPYPFPDEDNTPARS